MSKYEFTCTPCAYEYQTTDPMAVMTAMTEHEGCGKVTQHSHTAYVEGCFRCDLSRDELHDLDDVAAEMGVDLQPEACHCGDPVVGNRAENGPAGDHLCEHCLPTRCDAYPGECDR